MHSSVERPRDSPASRYEAGDLGVNWLAWAKLVRLPNVPTAAADVLAGYFVARAIFPNDGSRFDLVILVTASCCLYMAGMIWNDWFDLEIDRKERPFRPLPAELISMKHAYLVALFLTLSGCLLPLFCRAESAQTAALLTMSILAYDVVLKKRVLLGPICMGLCRSLNLWLGLSVGGVYASNLRAMEFGGFLSHAFLLLAVGNGIYITGVTWFARQEAGTSSRLRLALGAFAVALGFTAHILALDFLNTVARPLNSSSAILDMHSPSGEFQIGHWSSLGMCICLATLLGSAIWNPVSANVQRAIKWSILGLILIDAQSVLLAGFWWHALAIAALIVPSILLGRRIYST